MEEEKEKIQQPDTAQRKEVEKQTAESQEKEKNKKKHLLYALAWSVFVALFFMGAATAVDYEWQSYLLNAISSAGYISAAVCLTWFIYFGGIKNIGWKKRIVKAVATAIFFFGAVLLSVVTWGNVLNRDLSKVTFWLVAISWALVSIAIIVKQISFEKQDFDDKPVTSYLFILCGMLYAFAYAVILKFDFEVALKIFYTIHTVLALTVFINIIFKYGIKASNFLRLALFIVSIIVLMALLVSTLYFWFWDSYDPEIFTSIMGVFAGLLGGVLTLTGVAWTIKKQEETRKEEEKRKIKPYIVLTNDTFNMSNIKKFGFASSEGYGKIGEEKTYIIDPVFQIKNVGRSACVLAYIKINSKKQNSWMQSLVVDEKALIKSFHQKNIVKISEDDLSSIKIGIYDIDYNLYEYDVLFSIGMKTCSLGCVLDKEKQHYIDNGNEPIYCKTINIKYIDCSSASLKEDIKALKDRPLEEMLKEMEKITGDKNDNN